MNYCTYPEYQAACGTVSEAAFSVLCQRASRLIDRITLGRAESASECCGAALADGCAQIVELLAAKAALGTLPGAGSVSNDGYTVSFSGNVNAQVYAEAQQILADALGADEYGLLYRGCW